MVIPEKRTLGSWGRPFSSSRAGSASHEPRLRVELEDPPKVFFDVASDTCLADVGHAGIGGFCHGLFWFYEVPEDVRLYLTFFHQYLRGASQTGQHGATTRIPLRTDALTSALAPPASAANAEIVQDSRHLRRQPLGP